MLEQFLLLLIQGQPGYSRNQANQLTSHSESSAQDRIPAGWEIEQMEKAIFSRNEKPLETRILTWQITEDNRPLYIERCICLSRYRDEGKNVWRLSHLYRHPKSPVNPDKWYLSIVFDTNQKPRQDFYHAPTNSDLDNFFRDTWWRFSPEPGYKLLDSAVCSNAWFSAVGMVPTRKYSPLQVSPK